MSQYLLETIDILLCCRPAGDKAAHNVLGVDDFPFFEFDVFAETVGEFLGEDDELLVGA